jgi:hypothetical protein
VVLKFQAALSQLHQPCPDPERFTPRDRRLYRFVGGRPANEEHFEPQLDRVNGKIKCIHYALSMWATIEQAQRKYNSLAGLHDDGTGAIAAERYGDFICEIDIGAVDGLMNDPDKDGHVRLHQAGGVTFAPRISRYLNCEYLERVDPMYYTPDNGHAASP